MKLRKQIFYVEQEEFMDVLAFYRDQLGLTVSEEKYVPPYWIELETGECRLCLHNKTKMHDTRGKNSKIVFAVADVARTHAELKERGVEIERLGLDEEEIPKWFFVRDPAGNLIQFDRQ